MKKSVLFVRSYPSNLNFNTYNIQQIGMGQAFCNKGFNFDFVTFNSEHENVVTFYKSEVTGCSARYLEKNCKKIRNWGINNELLRLDFLERYDLIICLEYYQLMTYFIARKSKNAVLYAGPYWNMFSPKILSIFYDFFLTKKLNDRLMVKFTKSEIMKGFLEKKGYKNVVNIGVGLDLSAFCNMEKSAMLDELCSYMNNNRCMLYVGRIDKNKNVKFIVKLFSVLKKEYEDLKLVVIGKDTKIRTLHSFNRESCKNHILQPYDSKIIKDIVFVDSINNNELQFIYPLAKLFILPSKLEVFGMVLLEAMYFKVPVVTSYNGGGTTLITSEKYGQMVKGFDEKKWIRAIKRYLDDDEYCNQVKNNAHKLIVENYNWDKIVDKIISECQKTGVLMS